MDPLEDIILNWLIENCDEGNTRRVQIYHEKKHKEEVAKMGVLVMKGLYRISLRDLEDLQESVLWRIFTRK